MKTCVLPAIAALAIGIATPAFAQEANTVDPEVRQQIEAVLTQFDEAYNKNDAAATAALFTQDAVEVWFGVSGGGLASAGLDQPQVRFRQAIAAYPHSRPIGPSVRCSAGSCR
jgi:hypothetical protein